MKTPQVLLFLGIGLLLICGFCGIGSYSLFQKGVSTQTEAMAFATPVITKITSTWDANALAENASPKLNEAYPLNLLTVKFKDYSKAYGNLKVLDHGHLEFIQANTFNGVSETVIHLSYPATFEKRNATINVELVQTRGKWQFDNFHMK